MTLCPIAIAVGCKKCPIFAVCPVKGVIGDYKKEDAPPPKAARRKRNPGEEAQVVGARSNPLEGRPAPLPSIRIGQPNGSDRVVRVRVTPRQRSAAVNRAHFGHTYGFDPSGRFP